LAYEIIGYYTFPDFVKSVLRLFLKCVSGTQIGKSQTSAVENSIRLSITDCLLKGYDRHKNVIAIILKLPASLRENWFYVTVTASVFL
jgi:hypothetical protein